MARRMSPGDMQVRRQYCPTFIICNVVGAGQRYRDAAAGVRQNVLGGREHALRRLWSCTGFACEFKSRDVGGSGGGGYDGAVAVLFWLLS